MTGGKRNNGPTAKTPPKSITKQGSKQKEHGNQCKQTTSTSSGTNENQRKRDSATIFNDQKNKRTAPEPGKLVDCVDLDMEVTQSEESERFRDGNLDRQETEMSAEEESDNEEEESEETENNNDNATRYIEENTRDDTESDVVQFNRRNEFTGLRCRSTFDSEEFTAMSREDAS